MTPFVRSTMKWYVEAGLDPTEAHWFDISALRDQIAVGGDYLKEYRPPFPRNFVLWAGSTRNHAHYEVLMMVAGTDPQEGVVVNVWKGAGGEMPRSLPAMFYLVDGDQISYGPIDEDVTVEKEEAELMLALVAGWYSCLSRGIDAYVGSARDTWTNRRKIAQGKAPSYEWRTVYIEPTKPHAESKGGTHASPRQHDRRGHLRRLQSGKNVWVRPCKVGNAALGSIFHDYEVRHEAVQV